MARKLIPRALSYLWQALICVAQLREEPGEKVNLRRLCFKSCLLCTCLIGRWWREGWRPGELPCWRSRRSSPWRSRCCTRGTACPPCSPSTPQTSFPYGFATRNDCVFWICLERHMDFFPSLSIISAYLWAEQNLHSKSYLETKDGFHYFRDGDKVFWLTRRWPKHISAVPQSSGLMPLCVDTF